MWHCKIFVSQSNEIAFPISARHNVEVLFLFLLCKIKIFKTNYWNGYT